MADYIERKALINKLKERDLCLCVTEQDIKDAPAADVSPVRHGKWELSKNYVGYCSCSLCSDCYVEPEWVDRLHWRFCPNCGARMDGGNDV